MTHNMTFQSSDFCDDFGCHRMFTDIDLIEKFKEWYVGVIGYVRVLDVTIYEGGRIDVIFAEY